MNEQPRPVVAVLDDARSGDGRARGELMQQYRPLLRLIAEQAIGPTMGRRVDASDVVQQTCLEAHQDFGNFRGSTEPEFSAWLKQILKRNVWNIVRDNRAAKRDVSREQPLQQADDTATIQWQAPAAQQSTPSQHVIRGEAAVRLAAALDRLPADQKSAVRMRHIEALPLSEIAERMDRTTGAVAGLIQRGLRTLRQRLPTSNDTGG